MRIKLLLIAFATLAAQFFGSSSEAALSKYAIRATQLAIYSDVSPTVRIQVGSGTGPSSTVVIDNDGGSGFPLLLKYKQVAGGTSQTVDLPGLSGFIFLKDRTAQGPTATQTGTGDVSAEIAWGFIDTWTATGGQFCNSVPSFVCDRAQREDDETVPPTLISAKFDHHSWTFHPTGYRADPYIAFTGTTDGNTQLIYRGVRRQDGTVPALPIVSIGVIGVSLMMIGLSTLRRS